MKVLISYIQVLVIDDNYISKSRLDLNSRDLLDFQIPWTSCLIQVTPNSTR